MIQCSLVCAITEDKYFTFFKMFLITFYYTRYFMFLEAFQPYNVAVYG